MGAAKVAAIGLTAARSEFGPYGVVPFTTNREFVVRGASIEKLEPTIRESLRRSGYSARPTDGRSPDTTIDSDDHIILARRNFRDATTGGRNWQMNWEFASSWLPYLMMAGGLVGITLIGYFGRWTFAMLFWIDAAVVVVFVVPLLAVLLRARPRSELLRVTLIPASSGPKGRVGAANADTFRLMVSYAIAERMPTDVATLAQIISPEPVGGNYEGMDGFVEDLGVKFALSVA